MSYFPDLTPYSMQTTDGVGTVQSIGWLERPHEFEVGSCSAEFVSRLAVLCANGIFRTRGHYRCSILPCRASREAPLPFVLLDGVERQLGSAEIWVGLPDGRWFAAPNLIHHYVTVHQYKPPDEFVRAVLEGLVYEESLPPWIVLHDGAN